MQTGFYLSIYQVMDVIINSVVMNVYIQVFVWTQCILSPGCIPSNGMAGSYGNYLRNWEIARLFSRAATPFYHQQRVSPSPIPPAPTIIHVNCFFYYRHLSGCSDTWWFWISPCVYWTYSLFWKQIILGCFITVFLYCYPELLGADLTFFFFVMILTRAQCLSVSLSASWKCL